MVAIITSIKRNGWRGILSLCLAMMSSVSVLATINAYAADDAPVWSRGMHYQTMGQVVPLAQDGIHDPTDSAVKVLQEPSQGMKDFPRDNAGIINWVKVLNEDLIEPRQSLTGEQTMYPIDFDIIFKNTGSMPNVRFPHLPHTQWLTCANCHPAIFLPQKGGNPITMSAIIQGKYCGVCHGKVAFPPTMNCGRCHSVPRESPGLR
jgi:c(7)-type cytochrome triheme protein